MRRGASLQFLCILAAFACSGCFYPSADAESSSDRSALEGLTRCMVADDSDRLADQVLHLVNLERAAEGVPPVVLNPLLKGIAEDYACRMIDEGFFAHEDPISGDGPSERAIAGKYSFYAIGENLAAGQESVAEVMRIWMESRDHRANILDPAWEEIGIAVRTGGKFEIYWVQEFGQPLEE